MPLAFVGARGSSFGRAVTAAGLLVSLLFLTFPVYFMLITSLKTPGEAFRLPPTLWPGHPTLGAFAFMLRAWEYWQTLFNTVLVAGVSALGATILGRFCAYGFSRMRFAGKPLLYGLILVFLAGGLPVAFLTLFSYLKAIPRELDEAASMDGCSPFGTLLRIIVPLALPGAAVSFLLLFIAGWNEFLFAFTLTSTPATRLLTVRLFEIPVRADVNTIPYDLIAAGGVLILLPLVPLLIAVQKQLVQGIIAGAVK